MTAQAEAFNYSGDELSALEEAENYYRSLMDAFGPYLGRAIIEVGSGTGTVARRLRTAAPASTIVLVEPAVNNFPTLADRFRDDEQVTLVQGYLSALPSDLRADSIVAVNVLEHVEDDAEFIVDAARHLVPGGHLLLFVPALPALYGTLDERFEHFRRYTRASLRALLTAAGLREIALRYSNLPGVVSWFVAGRLLRKRTITAREVRTYDRFVMPWVRRFERIASPPIGQSLIAVYRKG